MTVSATAHSIRNEKQFPIIFCAVSLSFFPIYIAALGAPPEPANIANALISISIGVNNPTPVKAFAPIPGIWPIYILSTILYKRLTTCATTAGTASFASSEPILPSPRFVVSDILISIPAYLLRTFCFYIML